MTADHQHVLGGTGVRVSKVGLGALMLGPYGNDDRDECRRIIHAANDAGIDLIDTADGYSDGESEVIVGDAIADRRDRVFLSTKVGMRLPAVGPHAGGLSRRWIVEAAEASLRRLRTDHLDLYQLHSFDPTTPLDETLGALTALIDSGKVRFVGSSNFSADRVVEAQWAAERTHGVRLCTEQLQYSVLDRRAEHLLLPVCARYDVGVLAWSPLHGGWLTDRAVAAGGPATAAPRMARVQAHYDLAAEGNRAKLTAIGSLASIAHGLGLTLAQLALAFCTAHAAVASALVGPASMDELNDVLPALHTTLDDATLDAIDRIVPAGGMVGVDHQTPAAWQAVQQMRRHDPEGRVR